MAGNPSYGRGRHDTLVEVADAVSKFVKSQQRSNRVLLGLAIAGPIVVAVSSVLVDIWNVTRPDGNDPDTAQ